MKRPALMGILNVTPDSFSGDGLLDKGPVARTRALMEQGADIVDIGAESTRPGAEMLSADQEWKRLGPVLEGIIAHDWRPRIRLSVDTRHALTASRALAIGVEIINDVSGLADSNMREVLGEHRNDIVVMHALDVPVNPANTLPPDCDVVAEILRWKARITATALDHGITPEQLIYDPGIGFGKTAEQSLKLIESAAELKQSGGRWLFGHSRKSFMKLLSDAPAEERDGLTLKFSEQLAEAGIDYLRVHDIIGHVQRFGR